MEWPDVSRGRAIDFVVVAPQPFGNQRAERCGATVAPSTPYRSSAGATKPFALHLHDEAAQLGLRGGAAFRHGHRLLEHHEAPGQQPYAIDALCVSLQLLPHAGDFEPVGEGESTSGEVGRP